MAVHKHTAHIKLSDVQEKPSRKRDCAEETYFVCFLKDLITGAPIVRFGT
jgi:hypothetical protein